MEIFRFALVLGFLAAAGSSWAGSVDNVTVQVSAQASSNANLTLGSSAITFRDADPDTTPSIAANENPVSVKAQAQTGQGNLVTLQVRAAGDLVSGSNNIAISNVTWTATGSGYQGGTMSRVSDQLAGSWVGPGAHNGSFSYFLANSWAYPTGNYTQVVTYTLYAP